MFSNEGLYVLAGVGAVVAALLIAKLCQQLSKLTKQNRDQEDKISILEEKVESLLNARLECNLDATPKLQRLGRQISGRFSKMVRDLMDKVDEAKEVDICRNEATFTFEFKDIGSGKDQMIRF